MDPGFIPIVRPPFFKSSAASLFNQCLSKESEESVWEFLWARSRSDSYHFLLHSTGLSLIVRPHLNAREAGKCNLAENSKEGKKREMASSLAP